MYHGFVERINIVSNAQK